MRNAVIFGLSKVRPWLITLVFVIYTLLSFGIYLERTLQGDINNHILAGDMFGMPEDIKDRGIKPLYYGPGNTGWDGQFYYYISNDLLGLKDTPIHIDSPSYRYQRMGMSLFAALTAKIALQDWVSPAWYFWSYFFLLTFATYVGGAIFYRLAGNSALILLWSLSVGTQITLFNALPDAAADAFLIIAIALMMRKHYLASAVPFAFACLSREVYVIFPLAIVFCYVVGGILSARNLGHKISLSYFCAWKPHYYLLIPIIVTVIWQTYIVHHFGIRPAEQAHNIMGLPLVSWWDYFTSGLSGAHKLIGVSPFAYFESASLLSYLAVLVTGIWVSIYALFYVKKISGGDISGLSLATLLFVALYLCFGSMVMMHYTGYFKAISVFFFIIPFLITFNDLSARTRRVSIAILLTSLFVTSIYNFENRIFSKMSNLDNITQLSKVKKSDRIECFGNYSYEVKLNNIKFYNRSFLAHIFDEGQYMVMEVKVTNTSPYEWISNGNFGSVNMSYRWVDGSGKVLQDGIRSAILTKIAPGQSRNIEVVSYLPDLQNSSLILSPVQEGCAWFYLGNK